MKELQDRSPAGATALATAAFIVTPLPAFLTGAMVVQITDDLAFGAAGLGLAVALNRAGQGVSSLFLGRLTDRLGASRSLKIAMLIAASASVGLALTANSLAVLCAWLVLASFAHALSQPATNRLLIRRVQPGRLATAFGLKQAASPGSSMLAGFAVPAIAVTLGWRWAFGLVAVLALGVVLSIGGRGGTTDQRQARRASQRARGRLGDRPVVVSLSIAFGFALAANVAIPAFYVASAVDAGSSPEFAGVMLAAGSAMAIVTRLVAGVVCDRSGIQPLLLCAGMLAAGTTGLLLLATGVAVLMNVGVLVALTGAWGFNGVFWYAVVAAYADSPGRITGVLSPGGSAGATLGSVVFGWIAQHQGYTAAWCVASAAALVASVGLVLSARMLARRRPTGGTATLGADS